MNDTKITVVDLGNNNVKGLTEKGAPINFRSNMSKDFESYPDGFSYILLDGEHTYFEKGIFSKEYLKTRKDSTAQLLYTIAKLYPNLDKVETNLTLLLPLSEMPHRKKYEDEFKNKHFKFTVKTNSKKDMVVDIKDVLVVPEGQITFWTLDKETQADNVLIVDIGGRTTNIAAIDYGKPQVFDTFKIGILNLYSKLQNLNEDKQYKLEDIEKAIQRNDIKVSDKELAGFLNDIINEFSMKVNLNQYNVKFTGGGSIVLKNIIEKNLPAQCVILDDPLYTNVRGALKASMAFWSKSNG